MLNLTPTISSLQPISQWKLNELMLIYPDFMKSKYLPIITVVLLLFSSQPALAHVLEADQTVGAVIHLTPDDSPVAGERSDLFFEFKDKEGRFKPADCTCTVSVTRDEREIYSQPLFANNTEPGLENPSFSYTFPEPGSYEVKISGKPLTEDAFNPFELEYTVTVEKPAEAKVAAPPKKDNWFLAHLVHLTGGILLGGFLIFALIAQHRKKGRQST